MDIRTQGTIVVVHPVPKLAVLLANDFELAHAPALATDTVVAAVGTMLKHQVAAIVSFAPGEQFAQAAGLLAEDDFFPPCIFVGKNAAPKGIRAQAALLIDHETSNLQIIQQVRQLASFAKYSRYIRELPLRAPDGYGIAKFSQWLSGDVAHGREPPASQEW